MKIPVAILGATGSVGQKFISLLADHPWFEIVSLVASERSQGKMYKDVVNWMQPHPIPQKISEMQVHAPLNGASVKIAFSGLDASVAGDVELDYAGSGVHVISNTRNHRMNADVPLLVPEINHHHLELLKFQKYGKGNIVTNPNCSTIGLAIALKPLQDLFGIESVHVVTFQAVSGAGYPGVASLDIIDNVIPHISGEEKKMETETLKILGQIQDESIRFASLKISAHCNRVPVSEGHLECVSIKLNKKTDLEDVKNAWKSFSGFPQLENLPLAPTHPIHYFEEENFPQPKRHRDLDKGMAVSIGRLRPCALFDYKFAILSHNTIRGAAGGAILSAEMMVKKNLITH